MILFLIIPVAIAIPVAIYLYHFFKRVLGFWRMDEQKTGRKVLAVILTIIFTFLAVNIWGLAAVIILHAIIISILLDLACVIWRRGNFPKKKVLRNVYRCGLVPIVCSLIILGYGYYNMTHAREKAYTVHTEKNISRDYKVAMMSDLHYETTMKAEKLKEYCAEIEAEKPDVLLLCGDIVDESTSLQGMMEALQILGSVKTTYGVYYVYGNHDMATYSASSEFGEIELAKQLIKSGIHILQDTSVALNDEFVLGGRMDLSYSRGDDVPPRSSTKGIFSEKNKEAFTLLLDHQPVDLKENEEAGVDLQLSGHTHGGQIWPIGLISDLLGFGELNYGYEKSGDFQIIVSSGIGGWGYPIRTGCHSEYLMVTVTR